jgi:hypothetical protein
MASMKPWDEYWSAAGEQVEGEADVTWRVHGEGIVIAANVDEDRALLMAAAPDMARVLLAVEWGGEHEVALCPTCAQWKKDGHASDCKLDSALRKAGVR